MNIKNYFLLAVLLALSACITTVDIKNPAFYQCEKAKLKVEFSDHMAIVTAENKATYRLMRIINSSGVRYESAEGLFWDKGNSAIFSLNNQTYSHCRQIK